MVMLMKGHNSRERLSQSDGRTTRAAAGSLAHSANHGTMKLQHQRSVTNADDDLAQLRVCKRLTRRASLSATLLLRCKFWLPPSLSPVVFCVWGVFVAVMTANQVGLLDLPRVPSHWTSKINPSLKTYAHHSRGLDCPRE